jgi:hypothetical protein
MARCRARTENGTGPLCRNPVPKAGMRCHHHKGLPEAPPRLPSSTQASRPRRAQYGTSPQRPPASTGQPRTKRQRERVRKAAEYCADVAYSGWSEAVADRAAGYVSQATWNRLLKSRRRKRCQTLADIAAAFLGIKNTIHGILGLLTSKLLAFLGAGDAAQAFVGELMSSLPLPVDAKIIAAARSIQVTGIVLCIVNGDDLERCQCFIDLALELTKTQVKKVLLTATDDWIKLKAFPPQKKAPATA